MVGNTGLCGASQNIYCEDILGEDPLFDNFKGGLTENCVFDQLTAGGTQTLLLDERKPGQS